MSTHILAGRHPEALVVGVDKSSRRLEAGAIDSRAPAAENFMLVRADTGDFLQLANQSGVNLLKHYILYPNPWPKSRHLQRRWHGAPVFRDLLEIGGAIELRSNWKIYVDEFALAMQIAGRDSEVRQLQTSDANALTLFERKYHNSGQVLWQLTAPAGAGQP